jgi:hypothetical protein
MFPRCGWLWALTATLISTVSGRDYRRQVVPASSDQLIEAAAAQRVAVLPLTNSPRSVSELTGRDMSQASRQTSLDI